MTRYLIIMIFLVALWGSLGRSDAEEQRPPNVVVIFIDDMGYADIGPFGAEGIDTPHLDRMAAEGMRFTDFLVSSAVCSASRSAILTGCYHRRVGISGALGPKSTNGINSNEVTLAELCKQQGYATAIYGKWHLGHLKPFLPLQHGFDEYFGLPYSNDMWPYHPNVLHLPMEERLKKWPALPLIEGNKVVNAEVSPKDQEQLTTQYTERAVDFIGRHKAEPFFLYVPHSMVHVPLYVSDKFRGKSKRGLFGDVVMEVDWSVGEILGAIRKNGLDENTLVIFTADNGPWLSYGDHAGSSGPFREGKGTEFEGGIREPTIARWPGKIAPGTTCDELASTIDILPTVAKLIGAELPNHKIDGKDIRPLLFSEAGARSPHESFYCYYQGGQLQAVRDRQWKLHLPHSYRTMAGKPGGTGGIPTSYSQAKIGLELFDLKNDPGETKNIAAENPKVVQRLQAFVAAAREDLGDSLTKRVGNGVRPAGRVKK